MTKKLLLVALAAVAVSVTAFAQAESAPLSKAEKFYQVVPKHEFTINGFGGMSTLMYKVDGSYYLFYEYDSQQVEHKIFGQAPAIKSDLVNFSNGPFHPTGLGGGGGFGYIWHFHPNVGLMTGVDVAYYSGGIRNLGSYKYEEDGPPVPLASSYLVTEGGEKYLIGYGVSNYSEMQKYLALQVPIMFQFMAPMGRGNNHFYAAIGARIGFGVWNFYRGYGEELYSTYGPVWPSYSNTWKDFDGDGPIGEFPILSGYMGADNGFRPGDYDNNKGDYPWLVFPEDNNPSSGTAGGEQEDVFYTYRPSGKWGAKLINVMVSAELGFRWNLGRSAKNWGFGLYTALYADYGIPTVNKKENVALITGYESDAGPGPYKTHSVLNAQTAPNYTLTTEDHDTYLLYKYKYDAVKPLAKAHTLAAGLKLKFAFGKVTPIAPVVPILPKPDTVTKIVYVRDTVQNTVVVRDTVQNTVVVRDTVTNTVVVRDTITIIKEIPVEIQQTMRDLSNTLFEFNKFNLGTKARGYLDEVVDWLVANPKVKVEIGGHTDGVGSQEYNQKLSEQRAKSVYNYFVEHGVNKDRLSYKGYGKLEPIADNNTDAGRQQNRRVELKIVQ